MCLSIHNSRFLKYILVCVNTDTNLNYFFLISSRDFSLAMGGLNTSAWSFILNSSFRRFYLFPETETFMIAIQDQVIDTRNYQKHIIRAQNLPTGSCRRWFLQFVNYWDLTPQICYIHISMHNVECGLHISGKLSLLSV